jgi:hypothetical protein
MILALFQSVQQPNQPVQPQPPASPYKLVCRSVLETLATDIAKAQELLDRRANRSEITSDTSKASHNLLLAQLTLSVLCERGSANESNQ